MERLTERDGKKVYYPHCNNAGKCGGHCSICDFEVKVMNKLADYEDAEEQGLMKVLPVAIGSDIYFIPSETNYRLNILNYHEENNRVYCQKVVRITFNQYGWYIECDKNIKYGVEQIFVEKSYKVTWFTDESEAESALAKMKEV